ncbi:MAG: response regulator transcription factor [Verrucomicrobiota bacterium]
MTESPQSPIRILLVDDSELVRRGIKTVLSLHTTPPMLVVGEAGTVADAIVECDRHRPDVILLDIRLPDGSGLEVCKHILPRHPETHIIVLTSYSNDNYVYDAVACGAHGYLLKEIDPNGLVQAIQDVVAGRSILDPETTGRVLRMLRGGANESGTDLSILSNQERRVLALVAEGLTNKQVGEQMTLSENTVKNYLVNVFEKLQVKRRAQAAAMYVQHSGAGADRAGRG